MPIYLLLLTPWACFPPIPLYYPSSEATLVHFVTHLSYTVSYGTFKVLPGSSKNLHTEFGLSLDFTSMLLLFNTLHGIKYLHSVSKQVWCTFSITVLQQIYSKLQPFHSQDVDSSMLWAAFTLAFFHFIASNSLGMASFDRHTHLSEQISVLNPIFSVRIFLKLLLRSPKLTHSTRQPNLLLLGQTQRLGHPCPLRLSTSNTRSEYLPSSLQIHR